MPFLSTFGAPIDRHWLNIRLGCSTADYAHTVFLSAKARGHLPMCGGVGNLLHFVASADCPVRISSASAGGGAWSANRYVYPRHVGRTFAIDGRLQVGG